MDEQTAKRRFFKLSAIRIGGLVLTVLGVQIWRRGFLDFQDESAGKAIALVGVACMFLVPALLRRRWREGR